MTVQTWTVGEVCDGVITALAETFPDELWVRGEIQGLRKSSPGHVYFDLIEPGATSRGNNARMPTVAFRGSLRGIEAVLRKVGNLDLVDGIEVRIRGRIGFYPPQGRVQFIMNAIDPRHTLGQLSADRERLMRVLEAEGLLRRNAELALPLVPLRVGLVTSEGSAAYNDFVKELEGSPFAFQITLIDARVQGQNAEGTLVTAIEAFTSMSIDVIAIVRGGGAKGDLLAFDRESVARAVAAARVPVLVGIGHEIDRSVVDEVAHTSLKTPTACAAAIVDRVDAYTQRLDQIATAVRHQAERIITAASVRLDTGGTRIRSATRSTLDANALSLNRHMTDLTHRSRAMLGAATSQLDRTSGRALTSGRFRLHQAEAELTSRAGRVPNMARRAVTGADRRLTRAATLIRAVHPDHTLSRGYSITRNAAGKAIRSVAEAEPGQTITSQLIGGRLESVITVTTPDNDEPQKDV